MKWYVDSSTAQPDVLHPATEMQVVLCEWELTDALETWLLTQ